MNETENERLNFHIQYQQYNEEQCMIKNYVKERSLLRPKTNILTLLFICLIYCVVCGTASFIVINFAHNVTQKFPFLIPLIWLVPFFCLIRFFLIKLIECYQHYAKEITRRKCLCKPTCSEYSIAVLKKYPFIIALFKIRKRLFKTCKGGVYKIDPP